MSKRESASHKSRHYTSKQRRAMAKNITNLDGSQVISDSDRTMRPADINDKEHEARWNLAFGKISQEEFDELKNSGEFDD